MASVSDADDPSPDGTTNRDGEAPVVSEAETTDEAAVTEEGTELERTIGLTGGLAIGVGTAVTTAETPRQAIALAAADHDAVVMGESEPSLRSFRFGEPAEQVAAQSLGPVVLVRRPRDGDESTEPSP